MHMGRLYKSCCYWFLLQTSIGVYWTYFTAITSRHLWTIICAGKTIFLTLFFSQYQFVFAFVYITWLVIDDTLHRSHNRLPFVTWGSLTFELSIVPFTLPFVYILFYNLLYRLPADWGNPGEKTPHPIGHSRTNNQAQAAFSIARYKGSLRKST